MVTITALNETDAQCLVDRFQYAAPIIAACLLENLDKLAGSLGTNALQPDFGVKYIKFHHYVLVSCIVDTLGVLAAHDFSLDLDEPFKLTLLNVKQNLAVSSYNNILSATLFSTLNGQDLMLFHAIENASLNCSVSLFDYGQLKIQLEDALVNDLSNASISDSVGAGFPQLISCFGNLFVDLLRLKSVDLSFSAISAQCETQSQREFISAFENFMNQLPPKVYHCHDGRTIYSLKGFSLACNCSQSHQIDHCEAICDGGHAHFAVFRSSCGTTMSKVISQGLFRVKGIQVAATITAEKALIDVVEQAVASRKKI